MNCGALILAAGASRRLGTPKQIVVLDGETLLDRSIRIASEAGCCPIVVVLGAHETLIRSRCNLHGVQLVSNPRWDEGLGTSLAKGAAKFHDVDGIVVMTCDMPAVSANHLQELVSSGLVTSVSWYAGQQGTPAYFPKNLLHELRESRGDTGAKKMLSSARRIELVGGDLDIDTPEDLAHLMGRMMEKTLLPVSK
jgi:CTP:molybdopterin cytidylyltransferase MocA